LVLLSTLLDYVPLRKPLFDTIDDLILAWRGEKMALLPECAQAIENGFLLSKATIDAAAMLAFDYAGLPEADNPYTQVVSETRERLSTWRGDLKIIQPQYKDAQVLALEAQQAPVCRSGEILQVIGYLAP